VQPCTVGSQLQINIYISQLADRLSKSSHSPNAHLVIDGIARPHRTPAASRLNYVACPSSLAGQENLWTPPPLHPHTTSNSATMAGDKNEQPNEAEKNIEIWKVKKLIKRLEAARGNGTSMISLIIRT
jgi:hypothetical protein